MSTGVLIKKVHAISGPLSIVRPWPEMMWRASAMDEAYEREWRSTTAPKSDGCMAPALGMLDTIDAARRRFGQDNSELARIRRAASLRIRLSGVLVSNSSNTQ